MVHKRLHPDIKLKIFCS